MSHRGMSVYVSRLLRPRIALACLAVAGNACGAIAEGDSATIGHGRPVVMDQAFGCKGTEFLLATKDSVTELGFTADEATNHLVGAYESRFRWLPPSGPVTYQPGDSLSELDLLVSFTEGEAFFVQALDCPPAATCTVSCLSQIQVEVTISLGTADRVLEEKWSVRLGSWELGKAFARVTVEPETMVGTLSPGDFGVDAGWSANSYQVEIELNDGGTSGRFQVVAAAPDDSVFLGTLGLWPAPP